MSRLRPPRAERGNPNLSKATLLNSAGMAEKTVPVQIQDGKLTVKLPENTMYLVLQ